MDKFTAFVESLRTPDNTLTIDTIVEGYQACYEGIGSKLIGTVGLILGMLSNPASADDINWKKELKSLNKELTEYVVQHGFTTELGNQLSQLTKNIQEKVPDPDMQEALIEKLAEMQDELLDKSNEVDGQVQRPTAEDQAKLRTRIHTIGTPKS